jgi:4-amino-4-deoxy-L-arabinose transferase-like glycosyltransferase
MDMLLAALVTASVGFAALRALGIAGRLAIDAAAVAAALATLAKGPLGLLLPALVLGAYLVATRDGRLTRELLSPRSFALFALVAAPWYAAIGLDQGRRFLDVFLLGHNVQRFTSTIHNHPGPFWYYLPVLLVGLFPWSGLAVPALARIAPRASRTDLLLLAWLALPLAFFSLAGSKLPGYILPCLAPLAILMGRAADRLVAEPATPESRLSARVVGLVGLVLGALVATAPAWLYRAGEPAWQTAVPVAFWVAMVTFLVARRIGSDAAGALRLLRVGAGGMLLLVTLAAPPVLERRESGRRLFIPAGGREVLAWGAWRTAWMAGYFYNDGRVRQVTDASEILAAVEKAPALVLAGPSEQRRLGSMGSVEVQRLAEGPRENALLRVARRAAAE